MEHTPHCRTRGSVKGQRLIKRSGLFKHILHCRTRGSVPIAYIVIEVTLITEEFRHVRDLACVPVPYRSVLLFCLLPVIAPQIYRLPDVFVAANVVRRVPEQVGELQTEKSGRERAVFLLVLLHDLVEQNGQLEALLNDGVVGHNMEERGLNLHLGLL